MRKMHKVSQKLSASEKIMKMRDFYVLFLRKAHSTEHLSRGCPHLVLTSQPKSTEAMRIKCLVLGHNTLMLPGFEPSTSESRNRHSNHMTNIALNACNCLMDNSLL